VLEASVDPVLLSSGEYVNVGNCWLVLLETLLSTVAFELDASTDPVLSAATEDSSPTDVFDEAGVIGDASLGTGVGDGDGDIRNEVEKITSGVCVTRGRPSGKRKVIADTVCEKTVC
jgi:hypothetical protein